MDRFIKQPAEYFNISVEFSKLGSGETIDASSTVTAIDEDGEDASDEVLDGDYSIDGKKMIQRVTGGEDGKRYQITFFCVTSEGNGYEHDIEMLLKAI